MSDDKATRLMRRPRLAPQDPPRATNVTRLHPIEVLLDRNRAEKVIEVEPPRREPRGPATGRVIDVPVAGTARRTACVILFALVCGGAVLLARRHVWRAPPPVSSASTSVFERPMTSSSTAAPPKPLTPKSVTTDPPSARDVVSKPVGPERAGAALAPPELERAAVDALASGDFEKATELYGRLVEVAPSPVYQDVLEVLSRRRGP